MPVSRAIRTSRPRARTIATTELVAPRLRQRLELYRAAHRDSPWMLGMTVGLARVALGTQPEIDALLAEAAAAAAAQQVKVA